MNAKPYRRIPQLTLGRRLKMALGDYGREKIAGELGVDPATVSRWMGDKGAPPKIGLIKQWALITGTDVQWLLTGEASGQDDLNLVADRQDGPIGVENDEGFDSP